VDATQAPTGGAQACPGRQKAGALREPWQNLMVWFMPPDLHSGSA